MPLERGTPSVGAVSRDLYLARECERKKREVKGGKGGNGTGGMVGATAAIHYDAPMKMGSCSLPFPPSFSCLPFQ